MQRDISFEKNLDLVGTQATALIDQLITDDADFTAVARTEAQALDIDGVTNLTGTDGLEPGAMVKVEITDALDYDLIGQVVR